MKEHEAVAIGVEAKDPFPQYGAVLNVSNVAEVLQVSERTIYRLVEKDELPYRKVGRRLYFPKCEIAALLGV